MMGLLGTPPVGVVPIGCESALGGVVSKRPFGTPLPQKERPVKFSRRTVGLILQGSYRRP